MHSREKYIQVIDLDLRRKGISNPSLREDIVDHICILLEEELEKSTDFKLAYSCVLKKFASFKTLQVQTQKEIESVSWGFKFFKTVDYFFTLFFILLGLFSLTLPIAVIFYHPLSIFFLLSPLLIFGYIICFTRINYRKFELIQFEESASPKS